MVKIKRRTSAVGEELIILAIATATDSVSVAVGDGSRVLASSEVVSDRQQCEALAPMISFVCQQADVSFRELGAIAVDIGPGLFTGMRVGIASAKAIAFSLDLPVIGLCSLDLLAAAAPATDSVVVSVIDARRHEVYWSMHRTIGEELTQVHKPSVGPTSELITRVVERSQPALFVGNGALRYHDEIVESLEHSGLQIEFADGRFSRPSATTMVPMAHRLAVNEQWQTADQVTPLYLRLPDAQINWSMRSAS